MPSKETYEKYKNSDEWKAKRKEETKKYRDANKEILALKHKEYYEKNKDKIREASKETRKKYNEANKDKKREYQRLYQKEKITCECGATFRRDCKKAHLETSFRHKDFINTKAEIIN
jgi:hypothetical protein